ncbi:tape measure protein [Rhizobium leguminosarum]|uniref:tape measure protein n=1 Tax=Rhizobium ruizarguesonis TaxID=2081791 RepID=UPI0013B7703F|nr:tape measure protein [Rhizobium ruizarguesonis]NEJ15516.1 tape measure protein [Rhizobium ruizarguesonis]NEK29591.1 tape measure protein [Rhizobium ruizarguesonis]
MSQTLEALVVELRADVKGLQSSLQSAAGDVQRFSNSSSKSVDGFQAAISRARTAVLTLGTAWAAFRIGKGILDAGIQIETMRNKMIAATGDSRVAADALAFVREEANRLGLDIRTASDGFAGFSASALRAGLTLQQTKDIFVGVSEAAVSMRLPAEQVGLVFKALEQIAGKGVVSMEELRGQLGDALPGAFEIAAKSMGKTTAEFSKLVANGDVLASDFLPKFGAAIRKELGGSVDEASQGAQAAFNRLGNAFFDLKAKMAEAGFIDVITDAVTRLTDQMNDPATADGLKGFATLLAGIASAAISAASALGDFYTSANKAIERAGDSAFGAVFGEEGSKQIALARKAKANGLSVDSQKAVDAYMAQGGLKAKTGNPADTRGLSSEGAYAGGAAPVKSGYTLGTAAKPVASDDQRKKMEAAQKKAEAVREQLAGQAESMKYQFASPEQQATIDVEKQQETLKKALDVKAITEQEYRELSLEAEMDYQERLAKIRDDAREQDQSALEDFLGIRIKSEDEIRNKSLADQAKGFRDTISQAAQHNRVFFALDKAAAIARALIAARESVVSAYAFGSRIGGPPLGAAFAGIAAAAQAANIAAIASTSFGGGGSAVGSSGSSGSSSTSDTSAPTSSASSAPGKSVYITLNGDDAAFYSKNSIRKLLEGINDALSDGSQLKVAVSN